MKLRLVPMIISLAVSSVVLFGGWFLYDSVAMENPLNRLVNETQGVKQADVQVDKSRVQFHIVLDPEASLRDIYRSLKKEGAEIAGNRDIQIQITNEEIPQLEAWWSKALFPIAEAMEKKRYGDIPTILNQLSQDDPSVAVVSEIDESNVYIRISDGAKNSKFIVLPRLAAKLGVWPNE
jgi:hypothetical protein